MGDCPSLGMADEPTVEVLCEQEVELPALPGEKPKRAIARYVRTTADGRMQGYLPEGVKV